jgi:hypothetical protein
MAQRGKFQRFDSNDEGQDMSDVVMKHDGNKILFSREGESDWFLGVRVDSRTEYLTTMLKLQNNHWFTTQLRNQFIDIFERKFNQF